MLHRVICGTFIPNRGFWLFILFLLFLLLIGVRLDNPTVAAVIAAIFVILLGLI